MMTRDTSGDTQRFLLRLFLTLGVFVFALALWRVREALLLGFAAVIVAVILSALARPLSTLTGISYRWAVFAAVIAVTLVIASLSWIAGAQIVSQLGQLSAALPTALSTIEQQIGVSLPSIQSLRDQSSGDSLLSGIFSQLISLGWTAVGAVTGFIIVIIVGVFFALSPETYRSGVVKLFPAGRRKQANSGLLASGEALRLWLIGQLISMTIIGVLIGLGTWVIGLPTPLALGLIAGVAEVVPMLGPIVSAIPALILALSQGTSTALWTLLLFVAAQQVQSNIIMPQIQQELVSIPPALFVLSIVAFGGLFGLLGILLAAPLTVVAFVLVKKFYLGEKFA